mmetsp:Transcript_53794/g.117020  ORF Transcript_53794/g.117020 Transcript_53794/m.117020 type:complete len:120 (+) Transcript_53794:260-619(+)
MSRAKFNTVSVMISASQTLEGPWNTLEGAHCLNFHRVDKEEPAAISSPHMTMASGDAPSATPLAIEASPLPSRSPDRILLTLHTRTHSSHPLDLSLTPPTHLSHLPMVVGSCRPFFVGR